jgi:hypothetical protein
MEGVSAINDEYIKSSVNFKGRDRKTGHRQTGER